MHVVGALNVEDARLGMVKALGLLDTPAEERFDRFVRIAKKLCNVPMAAYTMPDVDRHWFKSTQGLGGASQTQREDSFCDYAACQRGVFYVPDMLEDARFANNVLVAGPPHVRFYAGAPLFVEDVVVGTLCVLDVRPRYFDDETLLRLRDLADCLQVELQTRLARLRQDPARMSCAAMTG
ncbi:GAF domain-containing protein [Lysobacter korlensis]|uniref:GAF domain-containing protein n=1 Tax=Lysobacter korlensis TaxID=553636 RepID=A0ABV6RLZ1_9GAMM